MKIGLIGCGTIGSELARFIDSSFPRSFHLAYVHDHHPEQVRALRRKIKSRFKTVNISELIRRSDFIVEAASASISGAVAREALIYDKQVLVMSVGGLLALKNWKKIIGNSRGKLWVPSGAVAGLDGVLAAKEAGIKSAALITRKPPKGLIGAPYFKNHAFPKLVGNKAACVFKGSAQSAVRGFPQNINVAAVLSLAAIGAKRTQVEIWTSKSYRTNCHEIKVSGRFGSLHTVTSNVPSPGNPKTSYLAILSARALLRKIFASVHIGT